MSGARVAAVVLNWNGPDDTLRCVASLLDGGPPDVRVIVVDNASRDDSCARISAAFPGVELVRTERNLGYAGGNNVGIERALAGGAEYVLVLNNDTAVPPGTVERLAATLDAHPDAAQVTPLVVDATCDRVGSVGGEMRWKLGEARLVGHGAELPPGGGEVREVEFAPGSAVLCRAAAIAQAGMIPDRYFLYFEDVDWSLRFRRNGWRILADPGARILHWESSSTGAGSPLKLYYYVRNNLDFIGAWVPEPSRRAVRARFHWKVVKMTVRAGLRGVRGAWGAVLGAYADHRAGLMGPAAHRFRHG